MDSPAFPWFFLLWWIPDFCLFVAMTSILYFWAQVFCSTRNLFLFSVKKFRKRILACELTFVTVVIVIQVILYFLIVIADTARTTLMVRHCAPSPHSPHTCALSPLALTVTLPLPLTSQPILVSAGIYR